MRLYLATLAACIMLPATAAPYPNSSSFGVPFSKDEAWYRQCMRVEKQPSPKPAAGAPVDCNAGDLYYRKRSQAVASQAEWDGVRACAVAHDDHAVLMMLYANGFGVPRSTDSAIHHACQVDAAKAEMAGRIEHLANLPANAVFDQCDDITSGRMGTVCASIRGAQDGRDRGKRLDRVAATLPAAARAAFQRLQAAAGRYALAAGAETDMQGTAAPSFVIQREEKMRAQFAQAVLDAASGKLPPASPQEAAARDRELNAVYQKLMAAPSPQQDWPDRLGDTTIERKDVRAAERAWIAYRDAFTAFAAQLKADANAVNALLTGQRIAALRDTARDL
ncbi:lysozyme inhibitor LprI family protein [Massilia phyllosphaerae]|uniref:lysozyme inhibitor LprI family protein n=1 Tax=Massilia phyllosphaerae TaxID=3106034 RepID=UPI002B1CCCC7|nr:lysozyme inhibitor LprI family protein [Massilia sp. SGZ-792]